MSYLRPARLAGGRPGRRAVPAVVTAILVALALAMMGSGAALAAPASPPAAAAPKTAAATQGTSAPGDASGASWMADLGPHLWPRPLAQILIPGSHDSATYSFNTNDPTEPWNAWVQTQDGDLTAQLNEGMRELDVRVGWANGGGGWDYYAQHGSFTSNVTLSDLLGQVVNWAFSADPEEIILLDLTIAGGTSDDYSTACKAVAGRLGSALITPSMLLAHFGVADPGQVSLGELWSLPDGVPGHGIAHVIMGNDQCMNDAAPGAGQWPAIAEGLFGGYYANQCTADGITWGNLFSGGTQAYGIKPMVLEAVRLRAIQGDGGEPITPGPGKVGGLYNLQVAGTPAVDCPIPPAAMVPAERDVLSALINQWATDLATQGNLNIVSGDYVEQTSLYSDIVRLDSSYPVVANSVTPAGTTQLTASQTDVSVPGSAFTATATYQGTGAPATGVVVPGAEVTYHVSQPASGSAGFGPARLQSVTVQADDRGVADPGADLYLNRDFSQGTVTVTATLAGPPGETAAAWTVVIGPATGFHLVAATALSPVQAGQTVLRVPGYPQYGSIVVNAVSAQGVYLPGVPVTFAITSAGTFPGGSTTFTQDTNQGVALAPPFLAGTRAGTFPITVSAPGAVRTVTVDLTISPGPPATFVVTRGGGQETSITTKFPVALQGHWVDQYGNVVTNPPAADRVLTVSPSFGAAWPGGQGSAEAAVAADGTLTTPDLTAGHTMLEGPDAAHSVTVKVGPASGWTLNVTPGAPAEAVAIGGDGQQTTAGKPFGKALAVMVLDAAGNPIPGAAVTFQVTTGQAAFPPPPGAAAYFSPKLSAAPTSIVVAASSGGVATAPQLTAGQQGGPIEVTAAAGPTATQTTVFHLSATGTPTAPAITGLTNGDGQVTVAFSGGAAGSAPITSYTLTATDRNHPTAPPVTATGPASPITVTGLTNGDPYVFTVTATSADGTSPPSAPSGTLNVGVPPGFTANPVDGTVGQPYSSGFTVTGAPPPTVTLNPGTGDPPPGLTLGSNGALKGTPTTAGSYTFTVQADNPVGLVDATVTITISRA